jgi:hypothetical protein
LDLEVYAAILKDESKWNTKGRSTLVCLAKKDKNLEGWWPRLTKFKTKNQHITIDWSRWVDPDDEPEEDQKP